MSKAAIDLYLIIYNASCCVGWAFIWKNAMTSLVTNVQGKTVTLQDDVDGTGATVTSTMSLTEALANIYDDNYGTSGSFNLLFVTQMVAIMEIVHAMLRLVRSPVMVTAMQVMSRVVAVLAIYYSVDAQSKSSLFFFYTPIVLDFRKCH